MIARVPAVRTLCHVTIILAGLSGGPLPLSGQRAAGPQNEAVVAIVGATLIDGNGGPATPDATIVVRGKRIAAVGPRASVTVPRGARVIDGTGKFMTPGFIDTNVHISLYNNGESMVRYEDRFTDIVIETAQVILKTRHHYRARQLRRVAAAHRSA